MSDAETVGSERERQNTQLFLSVTSRQKSASPQVHSGAIPIGFIVPSERRVAENIAPHDRHFAKHREAESEFDIPVRDIFAHNINGCSDIACSWLAGKQRSHSTETAQDGGQR